jgi:hypothetical protein
VKHSSGSYAAVALLAPLTLILALALFPSGCGGGGGSSATPNPTQGLIEVALTGSPSSGFQAILLNVVSVRINPSRDANVSELDPNWRNIGLSPGAGGAGELQVNLNLAQNQVQVFGVHSVAAQEYRQAELVLDPNLPGQIVPSCGKAPTANEGCLSYPFVLRGVGSLRAKSIDLMVPHKALAPLVLSFDPGQITPPAGPGGTYVIEPSISAVNTGQFLGEILGKVAGVPSQGADVRAQLAGTNTVIAIAPVRRGSYDLELPAQSSGTAYDLAVSGNGVSYAAAAAISVAPGQHLSQNFKVGSSKTGIISGRITDPRSGKGIAGATLNLLISPGGKRIKCDQMPAECVIAATANSDETGHYPLPGTFFSVPQFDRVPIGTYALQVTAAGYDDVLTTAAVSTSQGQAKCASSASSTDCSFKLKSTTITGAVSIDVPPAAGADVQVLVVAEDTGTNKLENLTMTTIPSGATSAAFTLVVPDKVPAFDLFASAQDFFNGRTSPFPGHTISVLSGIAGGATGVNLPTLSCVGHASLTGGIAVAADPGTTVRLSKTDGNNNSVQLMESQVVLSGTDAGQFSFCAPPDTYTIQRYKSGAPMSLPTSVTLAAPAPTSTQCPRICGFANGSCPGVCSDTPLINPL